MIRTQLPSGELLRQVAQNILDGEGPYWDVVAPYLERVVNAE